MEHKEKDSSKESKEEIQKKLKELLQDLLKDPELAEKAEEYQRKYGTMTAEELQKQFTI